MKDENIFEQKTRRLVIRPLNDGDYFLWKKAHEEMLEPQNSWDVANKSVKDLSKKYFLQMIRQNKERRKSEEFFDYAVIDKKTKKYIGRVSLMNFVRSVTQSAFIGYVLFNNYWGQGYAFEAVDGLVKLALTKHKLHRVVAGIEPKNRRSLKLAKKLGMRKEGISKKVVLLRGEWQDLVQFALTCEDKKMKWTGAVQNRKT